MNKLQKVLLCVLGVLCICLYGCGNPASPASTAVNYTKSTANTKDTMKTQKVTLDDLPEFSDVPYVELNQNQPNFTKEDYTTKAFETYSELDEFGRCGVAYANICREVMPTGKRGAISNVKPSGWHTAKYDIVDGKYLYNRCHLIGYQLAGENANEKNLITGTRYMNVQGMLPFEDMVNDYVDDTNHHVLYRVTPVYDGDNLVARGVEMEAWSVEDKGDGICFHVFVYNNQPGIEINYATGESRLSSNSSETEGNKTQKPKSEKTDTQQKKTQYILNTNTHKFHYPSCDDAKRIKEKNKKVYFGSREELIEEIYEPCGKCKP